MKIISVNLEQLVNFSQDSDLEKANRVVNLIASVINNSEFRQEMLVAEFKDRRFVDESGVIVEMEDDQEILDKLIPGKEQYINRASDYVCNFNIVLYKSLTGEIGKRNRDTIFTKKRKFRRWKDKAIASHWIHKYMHVLGFTHDYKRTDNRPYSVPYYTGSIAEKILNKTNLIL